MGWRPQGESRRLIFAVTDGDYHYALDGKVSRGKVVNQTIASTGPLK